MEKTLSYGTREITYRVFFSPRKTLRITVSPDQSVTVWAPPDTSTEEVEQRVRKRAPWILRQQAYFRSLGSPTSPRRFISGESHLYLGRQYLLTVSHAKKNDVRFKGRNFHISCSDPAKAGELMKDWYRQHAKVKFAEIAEPLLLHFATRYRVEPARLYIRQMEKRWGSCSPAGNITLNTELIKAPRRCIEYVIIHELCHLIHPRHTQDFYALLAHEMPDWEQWKHKLECVLYEKEK